MPEVTAGRRLLVLCAVALVAVNIVASAVVRAPWIHVASRVVQLVICGVTLVACRWALRVCDGSPVATRYFRATMAGSLAFAVFAVVKLALTWDPGLPLGPVAGGLQVTGALLLSWSTLRLPLGLRTRSEKLALVLDLCTLLVACALLVWHFFGSYALRSVADGQASNLGAVMSAALVGVLMAGKAVMSGTTELSRPTLYATAFSALVGGLATATGVLLSSRIGVDPAVITGTLGSIGIVLSAWWHLTVERRPGSVVAGRRYSALPYLAVLVVVVLLVWTGIRRSGDHPVVIVGAVVIIGLVVFRQLLAFRQNDGLLTRVEHAERQFRLLVQNANDITLIVDPDGSLRYASPAIQRVLGRDPERMPGLIVTELIHPEQRAETVARLDRIKNEPGASFTSELRCAHADGTWRWLEVTVWNLVHEPSIAGRVLNARDVTEARQVRDRLRYEATHDALTGLANRALFHERVAAGVAGPDQRFSIVLVDLDDFKIVNDTLGHAAGDALLVAVAGRMRSVLRAGDTVARLGGDEFALLIEDLDEDLVERILVRTADVLREPVRLGEHMLGVKASFGVVTGRSGDHADELLRRADIAMYEAKQRGHGGHRRYETGMEVRGADRARLSAALRAGIDGGELVLHYQPVVAMPDGHTTGVEALVRWQHPDRGLLPPGEFLPLAEETGLIVPLGLWVLHEATRQVSHWQREYGRSAPGTVAVNASAGQLRAGGFAEEVAVALAAADLPADRLIIEITESAAVGGGRTGETIRALRDLGVRLSLDDFGTGASTLSLLTDLHVDQIKLDRSFADGPQAIAAAVFQLARAFGLDVVAEGVETEQQAVRLLDLGYVHAQGFHFAHPMTADRLEAICRELAFAEA